ncbi:restriction endonuclease [Rhodanobacter sp. B04]|uniref:restriction endonuclease n=1 Tax=Rhodanobacter sp. B04 TaxID=1945860 RepID=UPI000987BA7D|nr:restriction endonuclease [Rhodanobacter sp. B04]OOG64379.1 restriction endonuclease [Rhodanobacter sp. B04]
MSRERQPDYKNAIAASGKDIYEPIDIGDADHWIPTQRLEKMLNDGLRGKSLAGLPLRTRSKVVKEAVCEALGYPVPASFRRTQPRFLGQQLDVHVQKTLNLQIWNEQLSPSRRYAIIQVTEADVITKVKVVGGPQLATLDTTGTVTTKYQASLELGTRACELVSPHDTQPLLPHVRPGARFNPAVSPVQAAVSGELLPIREIFERLSSLVGQRFADPGRDQERSRGAALHRLVCERLGYQRYEDKGQFPDLPHQLLEVKLQTSPTIDLGLVLPVSEERLDGGRPGALQPRHCDTRYAVFCAETNGVQVTLTHLLVTTGADFFQRFRRFEGRVANGKIQIPLPRDFFDR